MISPNTASCSFVTATTEWRFLPPSFPPNERPWEAEARPPSAKLCLSQRGKTFICTSGSSFVDRGWQTWSKSALVFLFTDVLAFACAPLKLSLLLPVGKVAFHASALVDQVQEKATGAMLSFRWTQRAAHTARTGRTNSGICTEFQPPFPLNVLCLIAFDSDQLRINEKQRLSKHALVSLCLRLTPFSLSFRLARSLIADPVPDVSPCLFEGPQRRNPPGGSG